MNTRLPPSVGLYVIGVLLSLGGLLLIVAPLVSAAWLDSLWVCWLLGAVLLLAGVGLCRVRPWAWYLALAIAATGLAAVLWRLLANGAAEWPMLAGALVTDVIMAIVLLRARPEATNVQVG